MKKTAVKIFIKTAIFLAISIVTLFFLIAKSSEPRKVEIKSGEKKFNDFSGVSLNITTPGLLSFDRREALSLNNKKTDSYTSGAIDTPFKFNAIGSYWKADILQGTSLKVELKLKKGGNWGDWRGVAIDDTDQGKDRKANKDQFFGDLLFDDQGEAFQYRVTLNSEDLSKTPILKEINFNYIDSTGDLKGSSLSSSGIVKEAKAAGVISRGGWGCPEAGYSSGWAPEYETATHAIIHHTAGGWNASDPASSVRAIWQYHTYTRGWGDIGYNYLIDGYGNVYEGRFGGENVVAGHAFPYNRGTIGISIMGDYSGTNISGAARDSLSDLIAREFGERNRDPSAGGVLYARYTVGGGYTTDAWGRGSILVTNIIGHRDGAPTSCPGNVFYSTLPTIRNLTYQRWLSVYAYPWQVVAQNSFTDRSLSTPLSPVGLRPGQQATFRLIIKNTSSRVWKNSSPNPVTLGTSEPFNRTSLFQSNWPHPTRPAIMLEPEVLPNQNATFIFDIVAPNRPGEYREYFTPIIEAMSWMNNMGLNFYITVVADYRWQPVSQNAFTDETQTVLFDPTKAKPGDEFVLRLKAKNIGNMTWNKNGDGRVLLSTSHPNGRVSAFATDSWVSSSIPAQLTEENVLPGGTGTFLFRIKAPGNGVYYEYFNLLSAGITYFNDPGVNYYIVVNGIYGWQFISQSASKPLANLTMDDTVTLNLTAKNVGNMTWYKEGANALHLGTTNPRDRASIFCKETWVACGRPAKLNENSVSPGGTGTFSWTIKVPKTNGFYMENVSLVVEGIGWLNDPGIGYYITVNNIFGWQFVGQGAAKDLTSLSPGELALIGLTFRNTGNVTWYKSGPVILGTSHPNDRFSQFYVNTWLTPIRPARIQQDIVRPGEIGTFEWLIQAPLTPGSYLENFNLVAHEIGWLNDPGIGYSIVVHGQIMQVSSAGNYLIYTNGAYVGNIPGNVPTKVSFWGGKYYVSTPSFSYTSDSAVRLIPSGSPIMQIDSYYDPNWNGSANYNRFRGVVEIRYSPTSNALWAINELSLEGYLKGIAETSNGHLEYLKTMSVIARSYAYWHILRGGKHAGEPFHLKNSRRGNGNDQVYAGYGFEVLNLRLTDAVNVTSGQVVSYPGYQVCITPYSHGGRLWQGGPLRTRAGTEIGLSYPWLQAVDDPTGDPNAWLNNPSGNHLVGLSASGASGWANLLPPVYDPTYYQSILRYYYAGTGINTLPDPYIRVAIYPIRY